MSDGSDTNNAQTASEPLVPGTPEYDAEMARLADTVSGDQSGEQSVDQSTDGAEGDQSGTEGEGEELILGKFKTQADLEAAYKELEKRQGQQGQQQQDGLNLNSGEGEGEGEAAGEGEGEADDSADDALDFNRFAQSVATDGDLSEADRAALEKKGIPRAIQDAHIAGIKALAAQRQSATTEAIGGEEEFTKVQNWANENLTDGQREAFNRQLNQAQSDDDVTLLYSTLQSRMQKAVGTEPDTVEGNPTTTTTGFASKEAMHAAQQDPRYATDPAYRAQVEAKMGATPWL